MPVSAKAKNGGARADSGIAGATAIAGLSFDSVKANSVSGSLGVAKNKVAGAVGYRHNWGNGWSAKGTVSASDNYVQGSIATGYSW